MDFTIDPSPNLHGQVAIPANKSHSFRALIMAGLAEGSSRIIGPAVSNDWMLVAFELDPVSDETVQFGIYSGTGANGPLTLERTSIIGKFSSM